MHVPTLQRWWTEQFETLSHHQPLRQTYKILLIVSNEESRYPRPLHNRFYPCTIRWGLGLASSVVLAERLFIQMIINWVWAIKFITSNAQNAKCAGASWQYRILQLLAIGYFARYILWKNLVRVVEYTAVMNVSRKDSHAVVPLVPTEAITFLDTLF